VLQYRALQTPGEFSGPLLFGGKLLDRTEFVKLS
jgi:hypothetical protein